MDELRIREERPEDHEAVRQVHLQAFGMPGEARLVDELRGKVSPCVSLLAERGGRVLGHIFFTPVEVEAEPAWRAIALGPMAVLPESQREGIGSKLVQAGLAECLRLGEPVVFVLGHPRFYPRFGFVSAAPHGLSCDWNVPPEVFMLAELRPGALGPRQGRVHYHPAFSAV